LIREIVGETLPSLNDVQAISQRRQPVQRLGIAITIPLAFASGGCGAVLAPAAPVVAGAEAATTWTATICGINTPSEPMPPSFSKSRREIGRRRTCSSEAPFS
jgi:hypothetical protein